MAIANKNSKNYSKNYQYPTTDLHSFIVVTNVILGCKFVLYIR
jgi:hypothetical protein